MATNAFGMDFWIGRGLRSKDRRDNGRHVVIAEIKGSRAKCHRLLLGEPGKMSSRGSWISLKGLATRWEHCQVKDCWCSVNQETSVEG